MRGVYKLDRTEIDEVRLGGTPSVFLYPVPWDDVATHPPLRHPSSLAPMCSSFPFYSRLGLLSRLTDPSHRPPRQAAPASLSTPPATQSGSLAAGVPPPAGDVAPVDPLSGWCGVADGGTSVGYVGADPPAGRPVVASFPSPALPPPPSTTSAPPLPQHLLFLPPREGHPLPARPLTCDALPFLPPPRALLPSPSTVSSALPEGDIPALLGPSPAVVPTLLDVP